VDRTLALFDFDGTLTTRDTFRPFLRLAIPRARLIAGGLALSPILLGHQLGVVTSAQARPCLSWAAFAGVPAARVRALGEQYASDALPRVIDSSMLRRLKAHQSEGDAVFVVSAGLESYLRPWCLAHGVGLVCTELEERRGVLTGRYRRGDCSGKNKATLVRSDVPLRQFSVITAYGDTVEDVEMLALAHRRFYRGVEISDSAMNW
jgi:phosphatidylglycerophosphatase C